MNKCAHKGRMCKGWRKREKNGASINWPIFLRIQMFVQPKIMDFNPVDVCACVCVYVGHCLAL